MFALRRTAQRAVSAHASNATTASGVVAARHISAAVTGAAAAARQLSDSSRRSGSGTGRGTPSSAAAALAAARDTGAAAPVPPLRVPSPAAGAAVIRTVPVRASASAPAQQRQPVRMQSTRAGTGADADSAALSAPTAAAAPAAAQPSAVSFSTSADSTAPAGGSPPDSPPGSPLTAATASSAASAAAAASAAERDAETLVAAGAAAEDAVLSGAAGSPSSRQKKRHRKAQDVTGMVAGEQGITLAPGSLPPATAEEHTSVELPDGPYRATAYEVGEGFDLKKLELELHAQGHHVTPFQSAVLCTYSPPSAPERGESSIKRAFFMEEGEVVFWGMSQAEEQRWLKHVQRFAVSPEPLTQLLVEDMPYFVSRDGHATTVYPDSIMLNGLDDDKSRTRQLMAFSISLARSLQLDSVENDLEKFIKLLEPLPGQLAQQKLPSRAEWAQIVSRQLALRGRLNLHSNLLEIPAIYWAKPKYESYYKLMEKTLDIPNRVAILNTRMDYTEHVTEVVRSELDSKRSHFAEWLIIALITLEVVALIAEKYEPYHNFRFGQVKPQQQHTTAPAAVAAAPTGSTKAV